MEILNQLKNQMAEQESEQEEIATDIRFRYKPFIYNFFQLPMGSLFCEAESPDLVYIKVSTGSAYCVSEPNEEEFSFYVDDSCFLIEATDL